MNKTPCKLCRTPCDMPACTGNLCTGCFSVETHLANYLTAPAGRSFVRQALHKATAEVDALMEEEKIVAYLLQSKDALESKVKELTKQRDQLVGNLYSEIITSELDLIEKALARK